MIKWLGLENYTDISVEEIQSLNIDGLIVGDPFCTYRMFKYGDAGLFDFIKSVKHLGKKVIYQTPVYITDRNFKGVITTIKYLYNELQITKYLVQDIGVVDWLTEQYPDIEIIWSHWGRNRNSIMNHDFVPFLSKIGVCGIENSFKERIETISQFGLPVYAVYGDTKYNTLSRECYNMYMLNRFDGMCQRECLKNYMTLKSSNFEMTINGHLLGRKIKYPDDDYINFVAKYCDNLMIYACDYKEAIAIMQIIERCEFG